MSTNDALATRPSFIARLRVRDILGGIGLVILAAGLLLDPHTSRGHVLLFGMTVPATCTFRALTGSPCPSCGMTRSVCFTTRGELGRAVAMHPIGPLFTVAVVLQVLYFLLSLALPAVARTSPSEKLMLLAYGILFTAMLVAGALRTLRFLPWPPL